MSTVNGIGTGFRSWVHHADGSSTATLWFLVVFLPVLPLRRYRLRTLTDFEHEPFVPAPAETGWLTGGISWTDPVEILARLPLSWSEIGWTYWRAYGLVPFLCLWPIALARGGTWAYRAWRDDPLAHPPLSWVIAGMALTLVNGFAVLITAARRMRGHPGSRARTAVRDAA